VSSRQVARPAAQQRETIAEAGSECLRREQLCTSRGELDCEWKTVKASAEKLDLAQSCLADVEIRAHEVVENQQQLGVAQLALKAGERVTLGSANSDLVGDRREKEV
jgi:hypothetical protein